MTARLTPGSPAAVAHGCACAVGPWVPTRVVRREPSVGGVVSKPTPLEDPDRVMADPNDPVGKVLRDWRDDVARSDQ